MMAKKSPNRYRFSTLCGCFRFSPTSLVSISFLRASISTNFSTSNFTSLEALGSAYSEKNSTPSAAARCCMLSISSSLVPQHTFPIALPKSFTTVPYALDSPTTQRAQTQSFLKCILCALYLYVTECFKI